MTQKKYKTIEGIVSDTPKVKTHKAQKTEWECTHFRIGNRGFSADGEHSIKRGDLLKVGYLEEKGKTEKEVQEYEILDKDTREPIHRFRITW